MAESWVRMRVNLAQNPKVAAIAEALSRDRQFQTWAHGGASRGRKPTLSVAAVSGVVVSGLLQVWGNARTKGRELGDDLVLPFGTVESLDSMAGVPGFGRAMKAVGWADAGRADGVVLPRFYLQNASTTELKKRQARERKRRQREKERERHANDERDMRDEGGDKQRDKVRDSHADVTHVTLLEKEEEVLRSPSENVPASPAASPKPETKARPRNALFDAIAEVTGADPSIRANASHLGKAAASLAKATPPYTPDDVREFGRRYLELCTWQAEKGRTRPTIGELEKHISQVRAGPGSAAPVPVVKQQSKFETQDERTYRTLVEGVLLPAPKELP